MKRVFRYAVMFTLAVAVATPLCGCLRQNMIMYEDGEWDSMEPGDDVMMLNGEIDLDDVER